MENASKALIMAGALLIAILVVSLGVYIFNKFGGTAEEAANMDEQAIAAFNNKITPYLGSSITGSQVNALLQYCLSVNLAAADSGETYKQIKVEGDASLEKSASSFKRVATAGKTYTVTSEYDSNGLITNLVVTQN